MNDLSFRDLPGDAAAERGYLVGIALRNSFPLLGVEHSLAELALLAKTAGIAVVGQTYQQLERPNPATLIGTGKVEELQEALAQYSVDVVIFDDELSPRHQRELEKAFGEDIKVLDRSALILDIFAQHARTREGALQVELAQYEYRLPRLTRQWTHLVRQAGGGAARAGGGGVGLRGPGETQLEVDRREIGRRIARLKRELESVRAHRSRHRQQRERAGVPVVALVGYTNAGKSTLLNQLSGADVYTADQLFATLDPTTRRVSLPGGKVCLFSDTVGFIQKLPTMLIAAFRATLEEVAEATLLLHVADVNHPNVMEQIEVVEDTLAELDIPRMPRLLVLNKMDLLGATPVDVGRLVPSSQDYQAILPISAKTSAGLDELQRAIERTLAATMAFIHVRIPYKRGDVIGQVHQHGVIVNEEHTAQGVVFQAQVPPQLAAQILATETVVDYGSGAAARRKDSRLHEEAPGHIE